MTNNTDDEPFEMPKFYLNPSRVKELESSGYIRREEGRMYLQNVPFYNGFEVKEVKSL